MQSLASDLEFEGSYLITTDYNFDFFDVDRLYIEPSRKLINKLEIPMIRHDTPDKPMSNKGPQYSSREFRGMADLKHVTSSTGDPEVERNAKDNTNFGQTHTSPSWISTAHKERTPHPPNGRTETIFRTSSSQNVPQQLQVNKAKQACYYNRKTKNFKPLKDGDHGPLQ